MGRKNIWDCHMTLHFSIKEKTNSVILSIAKEKQCQKSRVIQKLLESHPEYKEKVKQMEDEGFFI
jgi:hypothetical protein